MDKIYQVLLIIAAAVGLLATLYGAYKGFRMQTNAEEAVTNANLLRDRVGDLERALTQAQYVAEAKAVAAANSVPVFDLQDRWGSYSTANGLALMSDGTHPNGLGHYEIADAIFAAVQRLAA